MHHFIAEEEEEEGKERKSCFCEKGRVFGGCGGKEGREEEDLSWEKSVREEENWEGGTEGGHSFLPRATGQRKEEKGEEEHLHTVRWLGKRKKGCGGGGRRKEGERGLFLLRSAQERGGGRRGRRSISKQAKNARGQSWMLGEEGESARSRNAGKMFSSPPSRQGERSVCCTSSFLPVLCRCSFATFSM